MPIHAVEPLLTPPDLVPLARRVMRALDTARFASESALFAYAGPFGLTAEILGDWVTLGLLHRGTCIADPLNRSTLQYLALTVKGAREVALATGAKVSGVSPGRLRRSSQKRRHDVAVGDIVLAVLSLSRDGAIDLLGVETDEAKLGISALVRAGRGLERAAVAADAFVLVRGPKGPVGLLVEVDRGTIAPRTMLAKYAAYLAWRRDGGPLTDFGTKALRVLTVAPDARRLRRLMTTAEDANHGRPTCFLLFAEAGDLAPERPERLLLPVALALGRGRQRVPVFDA
jgi:hypothetical protein